MPNRMRNWKTPGLGTMLEGLEVMLRGLPAADAVHQRLRSDLLNQFDRLMTKRWKLIEEAHSSISMPFLLVLDF